MSPEKKTLVKSTWAMVVPIADVAATLFYDRLFTLDALMQALAAVVNGLDNLESLIPVLETLGRNHVRYGVIDRHYDTVGAALLWTLEQGLKDAWTPSVKSAWTIAYGTVAGVMRSAAASNSPALA